MSRRRLQAVITGIGTVATVAGAVGVVGGGATVLEGGRVSANVDSEFRFHATWYAVLGVLMLRAAPHPEHETTVIRAAGAGFLVAAFGRVVSWGSAGKPHWLFRSLMALEFAIPAVIIPWQHRVARETTRRTS